MSNEKVSMHLLRRQGKRGHAFIAVAAKVVHAFVEATAKLAMHSLQPQPKRPSVVQTHRRRQLGVEAHVRLKQSVKTTDSLLHSEPTKHVRCGDGALQAPQLQQNQNTNRPPSEAGFGRKHGV
eukprot:scaffold192407_cov11-Tisochrysis_lutea.AAC.1